MVKHEILNFVKHHIEPTRWPIGEVFRCSVRLNDGVYLPCVVIQEAQPYVEIAMERFDKIRKIDAGTSTTYKTMVESFICQGNQVNYYDIKDIMVSPYAIPADRLKDIKFECDIINWTELPWTEFTAVMDDGKDFCFGAGYSTEFFEMPEGYTAQQIRKLAPAEREDPRFKSKEGIFKVKPFFSCFV